MLRGVICRGEQRPNLLTLPTPSSLPPHSHLTPTQSPHSHPAPKRGWGTWPIPCQHYHRIFLCAYKQYVLLGFEMRKCHKTPIANVWTLRRCKRRRRRIAEVQSATIWPQFSRERCFIFCLLFILNNSIYNIFTKYTKYRDSGFKCICGSLDSLGRGPL